MALTTGLVSYWKLDETSGGRADSTVSTNTLTDNNTVTYSTGKVSNAAQFTAANSESLTCADNGSLRTGDIDFTFCAWVYMDSTGFRTILSKEGNSGTREYVLWYDSTGTVATNRFFWRVTDGAGGHTGDVTADSYGALSTSTWAFVVCWHDSSANTVNIQINNGVVDTTSYTYGVAVQAQPFTIGVEGTTATRYWDGRIDEVGFWKRVLTADERTLLYNSGNGLTYPLNNVTSPVELSSTPLAADANLVAYYKLEDVNDSKASYTLTNNNTVAFNAAKFNNGGDLGTSNTNKYLSIANNLGLTDGGAKTFMFWVKLKTEIGSGTYTFYNWERSGTTWNILSYEYNAGTRRLNVDGAGTDINYTITLGTSNWNHIAVTESSGGTFTLYVNGILAGTGTQGSGTSAGTAFGIGANRIGGNLSSAIFDDFAIFNRVLTATEISDYVNGNYGSARFFNFF
jgi:hypothetical protein